MLNPEIGSMWVEALRNGTYSQTRCVLQRDGEGHCCLGVLCDLVDPTGWGTPTSSSLVHHRDMGSSPSRGVLMRAGLQLSEAGHLAHMNDSGKTFAEIADYIEQRFLRGDNNDG